MGWRSAVSVCLLAPLGCHIFHPRERDPDPSHLAVRSTARTVQIETSDRWSLVGTFTPTVGPDNDASAVLLVHQLGSDRTEWSPLVQRLQRRHGITVLAVDLRGHGDSTRDPQGATVHWESFGTDPTRWAGIVQDVSASLSFLRSEGATRIVFVGSSIGSSAALTVASDLGESSDVLGVAMLSPGLSYHGLDTRGPMQRYAAGGRPSLLLAGDQDIPSAEAVAVLSRLGGATVTHDIYGGNRLHGVSLCNAVPGCWDRIESWVRTLLRPPPVQTPHTIDSGTTAPAPSPIPLPDRQSVLPPPDASPPGNALDP